jgi:hypothetical protein
MIINHGWTPEKFANLSINSKAFVIASIRLKIDEEKKQAKKMKNKRR